MRDHTLQQFYISHQAHLHSLLTSNKSSAIFNTTTALRLYNQYLRPHHAISLAIFPCHSTTTTHYATTADIAAATATYRTNLSVTTSPGISFSTTTTLSGSTYHDYSNSHHTVLWHSLCLDNCATISAATTTHTPTTHFSVTSTIPLLPSTTIASHTTHRSYHRQ